MRRLFLAICSAALLWGCGGKNGEESANSKLQYTPEVNEVEVITLKRETFPMQLVANGKLAAAQSSALYFPESGVIRNVFVTNGSSVQAGAVLASLEDSSQRMALESARIDRTRARLDYLDALVGMGYSAADTLTLPAEVLDLTAVRSGYSASRNNYEKAAAALESTVLRAPFSGRVADIKLKEWDRTTAEPFCKVVNDKTFDVVFYALESEYSFLEKGQKVFVSAFGQEGLRSEGRISSINPSVDKNGQISVTASIPGNGNLLDGMNVKVTVERELPAQLVVPKRAVVIRDNLEVLFRYNNGRADWVYVNTLRSNSESYAVRANADRGAELKEGDLVIVSGNLNLADGSTVTLKKN